MCLEMSGEWKRPLLTESDVAESSLRNYVNVGNRECL